MKKIIIIILLIIIFIFYYDSMDTFNNNDNNINYYVIHIRSNKKRYENILENQKKLGQQIQIYDAVIGSKMNLNNLFEYDPNIVYNFNHSLINEVGCYFSHLLLIKSLLNKQSGYTVIFEDDFIILDDNLNESLMDIIKKLPSDFDIVFLGNLNDNKKNKINDNIYTVDKDNYLWGTHGYLINNKNIHKIYDSLLYITDAIDNKYKKLIDNEKLNGYVINPILVDQQISNLPSTIR